MSHPFKGKGVGCTDVGACEPCVLACTGYVCVAAFVLKHRRERKCQLSAAAFLVVTVVRLLQSLDYCHHLLLGRFALLLLAPLGALTQKNHLADLFVHCHGD